MVTKEEATQFFAIKGFPENKVSMGGRKLAMANFPKEIKDKLMNTLAEKDPVMMEGLKGVLPGIKIDGKEVTKENIHEFEITPEKKGVNSGIRREIVEETYSEEIEEKPKEEIYKKSDLEKLSFKELKEIGAKFGTTDRSKKNLIKEILNLQ